MSPSGSSHGLSSWWSRPGPPWSSITGYPEPCSTMKSSPPSSSETTRPSSLPIHLPVAEDVLGLHHLVDLGRALVDDGRAGVPEVALNRVLGRVSVGAVHLDGEVRGLERALGRMPLGERRLAGVADAAVLRVGRLHDQQARRL